MDAAHDIQQSGPLRGFQNFSKEMENPRGQHCPKALHVPAGPFSHGFRSPRLFDLAKETGSKRSFFWELVAVPTRTNRVC